MNRKAPPRMATVLHSEQVSPNMRRITFSGEDLAGFPAGSESANVKLLLPHEGQNRQSYLGSLAGEGDKPIKRTYTVLAYRTDTNELDIEFALHDNPGPATRWANEAQPGDEVAIAGPGSTKLVNSEADWFLLAGDMSAMPAILANCTLLAENANGHIVLEVINDLDKRDFAVPSGMTVAWVVNPDPHSHSKPLVEAVKSLEWLAGKPSVWIAGESNSVRELRAYVVNDKAIDREYRYTSGYWQIGYNEDTHQQVKRAERLDRALPDRVRPWAIRG